ncbi:Prenylcysteine oxidase [Amphibalanus amphitrite]|uniref:Prenylcysteine oxidase n=1 Tax=Amphibalanus amphitrite TaxID=1232801 RepID=A0A6A4VJ02_AMPAM|nr:Prenylcysteine oxidase [Amphibalanus amphitrite]
MYHCHWIALILSVVAARVAAVKIGIVGGGIGGASTALYIRRLFGDDADIELFEMGRLGGRLAVEELDGHRYEAGGSVIHTKNRCMMELIESLGLQTKPAMGGTFGLWNGRELVFTSSAWSAITSAKLLWRYGSDVFRLRRLLSATLAKFDGIYSLLDSGAAYDTVEDLIMAMDPSLVKLTGLPLSQYLKLSGFQEGFISELVTAVTLNNYGQRPDRLHALVGLVGLAGAGDELTSVLGGNYQVVERAVQQSGATLRSERVLAVEFTGESFLVTTGWAAEPDSRQTRSYDIVVVAAPQTEDQPSRVEWLGLPAPLQFPGTYHQLSVTFVEAQAMEMSALAARNVANMAYTRWYNRSPPDLRKIEHTEL